MKTLYLIIWMIFMHICDDYYLQGWLAKAKQKKWWEENAPSTIYKNDYIVALVMHSISWSTMVLFPIFALSAFSPSLFLVIAFIINSMIHGVTDNFKANKLKINLIQDQTIHVVQIILTALAWSLIQ